MFIAEMTGYIYDLALQEEVMKTQKLAFCLVIVCMLVLLAGQTVFAAKRIVKFNVPGCE